nr:hypothetical protein [Tanacetum cinerariifolium]
METTGSLKPALNSSSSDAPNLASKIHNIKGKLRMLVRNITFTKPLNEDPFGKSNQQQSSQDGARNDQPLHGSGNMSFASMLTGEKNTPKINFRSLFNNEQVADSDLFSPWRMW